ISTRMAGLFGHVFTANSSATSRTSSISAHLAKFSCRPTRTSSRTRTGSSVQLKHLTQCGRVSGKLDRLVLGAVISRDCGERLTKVKTLTLQEIAKATEGQL